MTSKLTSEILDDETLAELIAFRRSRVEYCQKEGLPYQKALHDSMMLALEELQERRKVERDTEPYGFTDGDRRGMIYKPEHSDRLSEPVPVYRHAHPVPVVSADLLHSAASAIEDLLTTKDRTGAGVWFDLPFKLRSAANAQPAPITSVCTCPSGDGSLRWPCPVHPGNSPTQSDCCPAQNGVSPAQGQGWIPVSEQMPPSRHEVLVGCWWGEKPRWCCKWATYIPGHPDAQSSGWLILGASWTPTYWMELPAAPQEVKGD